MKRLLIGASSSKIFHLNEFAKELINLGIETKVVLDTDFSDGFPSRKIKHWIKPKNAFKKLIEEFKPNIILVDRQRHFGLDAIKEKIPLIIHLRGNIWKEIEWAKETTYKSFLKKIALKVKKEQLKKEKTLAKALKKQEDFSKEIVKKKKSEINPLRLNVVESAKEFLGTPYRYGGTTTKGLDCSGLTCTSYKNVEINLPRRSIDQSKEGIKIKKAKAKPGDLIFFKTSRRDVINHVGIITENNNGEISFIHASTSSGVVISSLLESYYKNAFAKIKRIIE